MATTGRQIVPGRALVEVDVPDGWLMSTEPFPTEGEPDLVLRGPATTTSISPRLAVTIEDSSADLGSLSAQVWTRFSRQHPAAVLTSSDVWPHPVWGDGRLVQSARVEGDVTLARDWYLFRDTGQVIRIEIDCPLADLLELEDDVADIVAHVRPKVV